MYSKSSFPRCRAYCRQRTLKETDFQSNLELSSSLWWTFFRCRVFRNCSTGYSALHPPPSLLVCCFV